MIQNNYFIGHNFVSSYKPVRSKRCQPEMIIFHILIIPFRVYKIQVQIIASRGYPVEVHQVTTDDGYILEVHRIPHGKSEVPNPDIKKPVVFIQHGFLNTDSVWLITPNSQSLGNFHLDSIHTAPSYRC